MINYKAELPNGDILTFTSEQLSIRNAKDINPELEGVAILLRNNIVVGIVPGCILVQNPAPAVADEEAHNER